MFSKEIPICPKCLSRNLKVPLMGNAGPSAEYFCQDCEYQGLCPVEILDETDKT